MAHAALKLDDRHTHTTGHDPLPTRLGLPGGVPAWIVGSEAYRRRPMRSEHRLLLEVIARRCQTTAGGCGSLVGCIGGASLAEAAGCCVRSLWRRLARLQEMGYVVPVYRGGVHHGRNLANVWGIPGSRGALDHLRATTQQIRMAPDLNGTYHPQVNQPGQQTIWHQDDQHALMVDVGREDFPKSVTTPMTLLGEKCHYPHDTFGRKVSHPEESGLSGKNQSGARRYASRRSGPSIIRSESRSSHRRRLGKPRLSNVRPEDLTDTGRLLVLYEQAKSKGWADSSHHGLVQFVAKAVYAQRKAKDVRGPGPLFVSILKAPLYDSVTGQDEDEATHRLSDHHFEQKR